MKNFVRIDNEFHNTDKIVSIIPDFETGILSIHFDNGKVREYKDTANLRFNAFAKVVRSVDEHLD